MQTRHRFAARRSFTSGAIAEFGRDGCRLRPNIVIGGVTGLEEGEWEGGVIRIGEVVIMIHDLRARCIMTTFDPDTLLMIRGYCATL